MPCLLGCLAMMTPRVVLFAIWLLSDYLNRAIHSNLWLLLGFLFMPLTTLAYAWAYNSGGGSIDGWRLVVVVIAVLADLGLIGGGGRAARRRQREGRE